MRIRAHGVAARPVGRGTRPRDTGAGFAGDDRCGVPGDDLPMTRRIEIELTSARRQHVDRGTGGFGHSGR
jgi:hypothetical protein